jgi:hypothetical protein
MLDTEVSSQLTKQFIQDRSAAREVTSDGPDSWFFARGKPSLQ